MKVQLSRRCFYFNKAVRAGSNFDDFFNLELGYFTAASINIKHRKEKLPIHCTFSSEEENLRMKYNFDIQFAYGGRVSKQIMVAEEELMNKEGNILQRIN